MAIPKTPYMMFLFIDNILTYWRRGEIQTHGALRHTAFQVRRVRPTLPPPLLFLSVEKELLGCKLGSKIERRTMETDLKQKNRNSH